MASCPCLHPTTALQAGCSSLQLRWRCCDSQVWPRNQESMQPLGSGVLQAEPFSFAAAKNGIGRGPRSRHGRCRRNHSPLRQRRLESDAEDRCSHGSCRRNHSSLRQRKLESDAEDRCRHGRSRRNHSLLPQRKLESYAENRCRYDCSRRNHFLSRQRRAGGF